MSRAPSCSCSSAWKGHVGLVFLDSSVSREFLLYFYCAGFKNVITVLSMNLAYFGYLLASVQKILYAGFFLEVICEQLRVIISSWTWQFLGIMKKSTFFHCLRTRGTTLCQNKAREVSSCSTFCRWDISGWGIQVSEKQILDDICFIIFHMFELTHQ